MQGHSNNDFILRSESERQAIYAQKPTEQWLDEFSSFYCMCLNEEDGDPENSLFSMISNNVPQDKVLTTYTNVLSKTAYKLALAGKRDLVEKILHGSEFRLLSFSNNRFADFVLWQSNIKYWILFGLIQGGRLNEIKKEDFFSANDNLLNIIIDVYVATGLLSKTRSLKEDKSIMELILKQVDHFWRPKLLLLMITLKLPNASKKEIDKLCNIYHKQILTPLKDTQFTSDIAEHKAFMEDIVSLNPAQCRRLLLAMEQYKLTAKQAKALLNKSVLTWFTHGLAIINAVHTHFNTDMFLMIARYMTNLVDNDLKALYEKVTLREKPVISKRQIALSPTSSAIDLKPSLVSIFKNAVNKVVKNVKKQEKHHAKPSGKNTKDNRGYK